MIWFHSFLSILLLIVITVINFYFTVHSKGEYMKDFLTFLLASIIIQFFIYYYTWWAIGLHPTDEFIHLPGAIGILIIIFFIVSLVVFCSIVFLFLIQILAHLSKKNHGDFESWVIKVENQGRYIILLSLVPILWPCTLLIPMMFA